MAEIPVLIGTFSLGPVAGCIMVVVKILIKLVLKPTSTGFIGEFSNLVVSLGMILPAVSNIWTFAIFCVGPFNLLKGAIVSLVTALVYKRVSIIIRGAAPLGRNAKTHA